MWQRQACKEIIIMWYDKGYNRYPVKDLLSPRIQLTIDSYVTRRLCYVLNFFLLQESCVNLAALTLRHSLFSLELNWNVFSSHPILVYVSTGFALYVLLMGYFS